MTQKPPYRPRACSGYWPHGQVCAVVQEIDELATKQRQAHG
jgi:hypothetical protein